MKQRKKDFGEKLRKLRMQYPTDDGKRMTLKKLAEKSDVDFALIGAVERGERNAGEVSLRKLAKALSLSDEQEERFVEDGLTAAGSKQILEQFKDFPVHFLHFLPRKILSMCPDIDPSDIVEVTHLRPSRGPNDEVPLAWNLKDGRWFVMEVIVSSGKSPSDAMEQLKSEIKKMAKEIEEEKPI